MKRNKLLEVIQRAETGPITLEKHFDLKVLNAKVKEVVKEYDIRFSDDPTIVIPSDNSLADSLFQAAVDLYLETGTYCMSNHRQIIFEEAEIRGAFRNAPAEITFGAGSDTRNMKNRKVEDTTPPLCLTSGGGEISEEIYVQLIQSYAQEPLADTVSGGFPLHKISGMDPKPGTPAEVLASIYNIKYAKEGARLAGRPSIGFHNLLGSALSASGYIAATQPEYGVRPVDGNLIASMAELKTDFAQLSKALYYTERNNVLIGAVYVPLMGGYAGGPEGTAVVTLAHHFQGLMVHNVAYSDFPVLHLQHSCSTARETLWIAGIVGQALSRNTHLLSATEAITAAGPCTEMCLYEVAANAVIGAVSGIHINSASAAKSQYLDRESGMEARIGCEVGHAATGMKRDSANELVNAILAKYEPSLGKAPLGKTFQECYDLKTLQPSNEHTGIYNQVKKELHDLGLNFS
ncbi:MAG: monomethylamine:corrinoid methyltransferase [Candidatus Thorarchaeota archaeon]